MRRDDSGAIAIIVAFFAIALFGFAALVVDVRNASDVRAQASAAADAGALAGEHELAAWVSAHAGAVDDGLAATVQAAVNQTYAVSPSQWSQCVDDSMPAAFVATAFSKCIQYEVSLGAGDVVTGTSVRVRIPARQVQSTVAGVFGVGSINVSPVAAAAAGQDPPSPCVPCEPRLDDATGQPVSQATLPDDVRARLPRPADLPVGDPGDGCPAGPGLFTADLTIVGDCTLSPGVYVFVDAALTVPDGATLANAPADPDAEGVTLVFYGAGTLQARGALRIVATPANKPPSSDAPIPGVAIVIDQDPSGPAASVPRSFDLGPSFDVTGSVYALDGDTTWVTRDGDCAEAGDCRLHDDGVTDRLIAVTNTAFGDGNRVPTVAADHPAALPPPRAEHLSE